MLKIKNKVDLEKLARFGYKQGGFFNEVWEKQVNSNTTIRIWYDRGIVLAQKAGDTWSVHSVDYEIDEIKDLVKAGYVERVEE